MRTKGSSKSIQVCLSLRVLPISLTFKYQQQISLQRWECQMYPNVVKWARMLPCKQPYIFFKLQSFYHGPKKYIYKIMYFFYTHIKSEYLILYYILLFIHLINIGAHWFCYSPGNDPEDPKSFAEPSTTNILLRKCTNLAFFITGTWYQPQYVWTLGILSYVKPLTPSDV